MREFLEGFTFWGLESIISGEGNDLVCRKIKNQPINIFCAVLEIRKRGIRYGKCEIHYFISLIRQRTIQAQVVERAKILIYKAQGDASQTIADRKTVPEQI